LSFVTAAIAFDEILAIVGGESSVPAATAVCAQREEPQWQEDHGG
jgi:hypothetical protein